MRVDRLSILLTLVCVGLAGWVYQQWLAYRTVVPDLVPRSNAVVESRQPASAPPPMAPLASYSEIVERPLFDASRRPPPEPEAKQAAAPKPPTNYKLEGTAVMPDNQVAVVRNKRTSELHRLAVGESVGGWQLDEVIPGHAALSQGTQKIQLELERPTSTPVR